MADKPVVFVAELSPIDKAWLVWSMHNSIKMQTRSRDKEVTGSQVYNLRTVEIAQLTDLRARIDGLTPKG